jgi:hypothetical protein
VADFGIWHCRFVRIGLRHQVRRLSARLRQGIQVKLGDTRSRAYIEEYGDRCWEADVLSADTIRREIEISIESWYDAKLWQRRAAEIERARSLL